MSAAILYIATLVLFLAIDYVGLSYLIKPVFERDVGHLLRADLQMLPALMFYLFFIFCVCWFVSWPALDGGGSLLRVFGSAALLGAMAYGTYEFTNLATLKGWSWTIVAADLSWGSLLTGVSAAGGLALTRLIVALP